MFWTCTECGRKYENMHPDTERAVKGGCFDCGCHVFQMPSFRAPRDPEPVREPAKVAASVSSGMGEPGLFTEADVVSIYTQAQAIEDGIKIDLSQWAEPLGIRPQTTVTRAVWDQLIEKGMTWDEAGDYEDTVKLQLRGKWLLQAARAAMLENPEDHFAAFDYRDKESPHNTPRKLWAILDGDGITILFPDDY